MTVKHYCTTCGIEIIDCGRCINCIEVEVGLKKYIQSDKGYNFVLETLSNYRGD